MPSDGQNQQKPTNKRHQVKVSIESGELVIRLPMNPQPVPSESKKTLVVASSHGNQATTAVVNGKPVVVGVNAYIKP
jgi:polysaccharide deacetylase 2 family uncharacterized protein YibQ